MRRFLAKTVRSGLRMLATIRFLLPVPTGARIITYHSVRPGGEGPRSAYVHPDDFAAQIDWLVSEGTYKVVSLSDLVDQLRSKKPVPANWVCITFDDGYADNYVHAFPVLKRHGLPATVFLVTGAVGQDPKYLTTAQIAEMQAHGITFGAHTVDHVSLSSVTPAEARDQILRSKAQAARLTGADVDHFCYPCGHYNATVESFVREAGFRSCCTEQAGVVQLGTDPLRLVRAGILGTDTLQDFQLKVHGAYDWWINRYMQYEERRRRKREGVHA